MRSYPAFFFNSLIKRKTKNNTLSEHFLKAIEQSQKTDKSKSLTHKYTPSLFHGLLRALQYKKCGEVTLVLWEHTSLLISIFQSFATTTIGEQ